MRSLFASILAISTSTITLPAISQSIDHSPYLNQSQSTNRSFHHSLIATSPEGMPAVSAPDFQGRSRQLIANIPANVLGLVALDLDMKSWRSLGANTDGVTDPWMVLQQVWNVFEPLPDISLAENVRPWLGGEVAIAFIGMAENQEDFLMAAIAPVTNNSKFDEFVQKLNDLPAYQMTETRYKGIKIWEWHWEETETEATEESEVKYLLKSLDVPRSGQIADAAEMDESANEDMVDESSADSEEMSEETAEEPRIQHFAIARLRNGMVVIASNAQTVQQIIDIPRTGAITSDPIFQRSFQNPQWNKSLIAGYGDMRQFGKIANILAAELPEESDIPGFSRADYLKGLEYSIDQYKSFDVFAWQTPTGIRSQSNSYYSTVRPPLPKDTAPQNRLLSFLPANTYGSINSRNLAQQWQWLVTESEAMPTYKLLVEGVRMIVPAILGSAAANSGFDLNIEKDIIAWMDGEYAVSVFPSDRSPFKEVGIDVAIGILARTSQPEAAKATLAKITDYLTKISDGELLVKKRQVGSSLFTSWEFISNAETGATQSIFAYGWRDPQTLIITLGTDVARELLPMPKEQLSESPIFREAIADMPQPNFGYFYLNARAIAKPLAYFFLQEFGGFPEGIDENKKVIPEEIQKSIDRLGGIVFAYSETRDRIQADVFFGLK
ncbi:MAG: DUF3352 domain-containing protein [Pseudanabaenaceae cyanobacterium bins.39]|nr:DUF3352 domain-containing protein [Pseudanabaenaceae cyanobacterium bins.39]